VTLAFWLVPDRVIPDQKDFEMRVVTKEPTDAEIGELWRRRQAELFRRMKGQNQMQFLRKLFLAALIVSCIPSLARSEEDTYTTMLHQAYDAAVKNGDRAVRLGDQAAQDGNYTASTIYMRQAEKAYDQAEEVNKEMRQYIASQCLLRQQQGKPAC
jgi:hypothetical protein